MGYRLRILFVGNCPESVLSIYSVHRQKMPIICDLRLLLIKSTRNDPPIP